MEQLLLKLQPIRTNFIIPVQHKFNQRNQLIRISSPQSLQIEHNRLKVNSSIVISITLILVLIQSHLKHDHSHRPNITLVSIAFGITLLFQY